MELSTLARALSTSPLWDESLATLVVRPPPDPLLGVIGFFDETLRARLQALSWQLGHGGASIRYVDYLQAEEDCARLAARLRERWNPAELARFRWVAIPRGGLFVLGMLAYILDLPPTALEPPSPSEETLVIVDDCTLSGSRFRSFLGQHPSGPVVFAHLYSHPDLRAAIEASEERVVACVSADDLRDLAPGALGGDYEAWREQWRIRSTSAYWVGRTEHLCFAWNEPDFTFLNPTVGDVERGWRQVPGEACLKHRAASKHRPVPVQIQPAAKGPLSPPAHVVFGRLADRLVVGNAQTGEAVVLDAVAADMWEAIVAEGDVPPAAVALAGSYDVTPATLRSDLERFVAEAAALGLLARQDGSR